ncbi:MAG: transcriptional regulator NrdR [Synergistales bacterium]|nr:transcriptional regulator NrdR [Synergistales bacterium]
MRCPSCGSPETRVVETRTAEEGRAIRRRRLCAHCGVRFTTYERVEERPLLLVVKKDGRRESFSRGKLVRGFGRACEKRPVSVEMIEEAASRIEHQFQREGLGEVASTEIGERAMEELRRLDKVAYVRFASVYREFADLHGFTREIGKLLEEKT